MSSPRVLIEGQGRDARMRRQSRALAKLAQQLWQSGDGLQAALFAIAETAARVLRVGCVTVWKCESGGGMSCVHSFELATNAHNSSGFDREHLNLAALAGIGLPTSRVIRTGEGSDLEGQSALSLHLLGRDIESLIESPIRVGAVVMGPSILSIRVIFACGGMTNLPLRIRCAIAWHWRWRSNDER
jgi:hypothetical protein